MKKILLSLVTLLTTTSTINAMPYQQAREQALFLTDKMAYELNLTEQQYEAAYEINLDYLMDVNTVDDVYSACWRQRNADLQCVLLSWQYTTFRAATYFFRPLYWSAGNWHFSIYAHYPHRDFYYFSRPACYVSYRGGHSWRYNGGTSWYIHHAHNYRNTGRPHIGLRDNFHRNGHRDNVAPHREAHRQNDDSHRQHGQQRPEIHRNNRPGTPVYNNGNRTNYNNQNRNDRRNYTRESSTRTTVNTRDNGSRGNYGDRRGTTSGNRNAFGTRNSDSNPSRNTPSRSFSSGNNNVSRGSGNTFRGTTDQQQGSSPSRIGRR